MHVSSAPWGELLIDYVDNMDLISHKAIWKNPLDLPIDISSSRDLSAILASRLVYMSHGNDKLIWCPSKDGLYSVKSGYVSLQHMASHHSNQWAFSFCWDKSIIPKVRVFSWLTIQGRILNCDRLARLHIALPFTCVLCNMYSDIVDHLFVHCLFFQ